VAEAAAPHLERLRALSWSTFSLTLPPGWEVTAYQLDERAGRFQFHQRAEPRGEVSWRQVKGRPDEGRIMSEVHRRWLAREAPAEVAGFAGMRLSRVGDFTVGIHRHGAPAQASLYQPETRLLLQWLLPDHDEERFAREVVPLLESYRSNLAWPRRWQLFGLGLRLPETFVFDALKPLPANVTVVFETKKNLRLTARRLGLDREMLAGTDLGLLHRRLLMKDGAKVLRNAATEVRGHPAVRTEFERRGESRMETLTGRWWPGEAWMWHDRAEGRIYALEQVGPAKQPRLGVADAIG
jgi:hypothetical protein